MINPAYAGLLHDVRRAFQLAKPNSIQLHKFLDQDQLARLNRAIKKLKFKENYVPDLHYYKQAEKIPKELKQLMRQIAGFVQFVSGKKVKCKEITIRSFGKKHYTLLHDAKKEKPGIDFVLDLTPKWDPEAGGSMIYMKNGEDIITIRPAFNTFSLVKRTKDMMRFVKYVNHKAKNKILLVQGTFTL